MITSRFCNTRSCCRLHRQSWESRVRVEPVLCPGLHSALPSDECKSQYLPTSHIHWKKDEDERYLVRKVGHILGYAKNLGRAASQRGFFLSPWSCGWHCIALLLVFSQEGGEHGNCIEIELQVEHLRNTMRIVMFTLRIKSSGGHQLIYCKLLFDYQTKVFVVFSAASTILFTAAESNLFFGMKHIIISNYYYFIVIMKIKMNLPQCKSFYPPSFLYLHAAELRWWWWWWDAPLSFIRSIDRTADEEATVVQIIILLLLLRRWFCYLWWLLAMILPMLFRVYDPFNVIELSTHSPWLMRL